jgi:hypothetical protein
VREGVARRYGRRRSPGRVRRRAAALGGRRRGVQILLRAKEGDVRVTTAFNRLLRLPGAAVIDVSFGGEGVIVTVRLRRRRRVCGCCGQTGGLEIHDRRLKRWRHLDLGASRCVIECELRRLRCLDCGVHLEAIPAKGGTSPHPETPRQGRARPAALEGRDRDNPGWRRHDRNAGRAVRGLILCQHAARHGRASAAPRSISPARSRGPSPEPRAALLQVDSCVLPGRLPSLTIPAPRSDRIR